MKTILALALAATVSAGAAAPALARDGCGMGLHAGPHGRCLPNRMGGFYRGYGYWDGHRYWQNRHHGPHGWEYR